MDIAFNFVVILIISCISANNPTKIPGYWRLYEKNAGILKQKPVLAVYHIRTIVKYEREMDTGKQKLLD